MASLDGCIVAACEDAWEKEFLPGIKNRDNCSGFIKSVASALGILLPKTANADLIMDSISASWTKLGSGTDASQKAAVGKLVIAGLKAAAHAPPRDNGHVVIVISGVLYKEKISFVLGRKYWRRATPRNKIGR